MNRLILVCSVGVGASLSFVYAIFAGLFLERLVLSTVTAVELVVVVDQFVKVAGLVGYYRTRSPSVPVLLFLFSLENLAAFAILLASAVYPIHSLDSLANTFFSTWITGVTLALPPYLIFVSVVQMMRSRDPFLLLSPALEFGFLAFAASSLLVFTNTFALADFLQSLVGAANYALASGAIPGLSSVYILVPSVVMFCSLIVRITIPTPTSATPPRVTLVLPLLAAVVGLAWISAGVRVVPNTLVFFTVPGVLITGALYAYMRR